VFVTGLRFSFALVVAQAVSPRFITAGVRVCFLNIPVSFMVDKMALGKWEVFFFKFFGFLMSVSWQQDY
jgi:hypothetical protein